MTTPARMSACARSRALAGGAASATWAGPARPCRRTAPPPPHLLGPSCPPAGGGRPRPRRHARAAAATDANRLPPLPPLEGESFDYCTDASCTISPAVAATARTLALDVSRGAPARPATAWTASAFQPGVRYTSDVGRAFVGRDGYARCDWVGAVMDEKSARVAVTRLRMTGPATAEISWSLDGAARGLPGMEGGAALGAAVVSTFSLDPITGRVASHDDRLAWDPATPAPTRLAASAARAAWAARRAAEDAASAGAKALQSLASMDGDEGDEGAGGYISRDPSDPTKFFQDGPGGDGVMADAFTFAAVVALFWVLAQAWASLETVKF